MTMDHVLLYNQCFEVEKSKVSIKIENFDIELKPETKEIQTQTNDSELLGRINVNIEAKEPEIVRFNKDLLAKEDKPIEAHKEVLAKEDELVKLDKVIDTDDLNLNERNKLTFLVEPETIIIKMEEELLPLLPLDRDVIKLEMNTTPVEYEIYKLVKPEEEEDNDELNPLLKDYEDEHSSLTESLSSTSSVEFRANEQGVGKLSKDDPKSVLTWNVCGLAKTKSKKFVWDPFVELIKQHEPDIVILQDVKLCSSKILGEKPRLSQRLYGGHVVPSYAQETEDANLINELKRTIFRKYYCIHSLSAWRIAGQLVFIKNEFKEGRSIVLQFKSFYLISLLSPEKGWINRSVLLKNRWDREIAVFLNNSKSKKASIITGSLNCAPEDIDLTEPEKLKQENSVVLHEQDVIGYPGSRDIDREGYKWILDAGKLVDVFRYKHPYKPDQPKPKNLKYTTLAYLSDKTKCLVRTDLVLMTKSFLNNAKMCEIIGGEKDLDPSKWRHLPQLLKLQVIE